MDFFFEQTVIGLHADAAFAAEGSHGVAALASLMSDKGTQGVGMVGFHGGNS